MTIKDWIQLAALVGALFAQYVAMDRRMTVLETKMEMIYSGRLAGK